MLRRLASKLHLYLGLVAGALLVPIGVTGSALVFHDEIEAALYPELVEVTPRGEPVSVDAVVEAVEAAFPDEEIGRMELPGRAGEPYEAVLRGSGRQVYVDPYDAAVIEARLPGETVTGWLFLLHVHLLAGEAGKTVVGMTGLVLVLLGLTGVVLWWRGWRRVRRGLTVKWSASGRRVNYDLHGAAGMYVLLPLLVVAFTGAGLIFYGTFEAAAHDVTGTPRPAAPPVSTPRPGAADASYDRMVARAHAALPEGRPARIDFPASPEAPVRVRLRVPGELHPIGLSMVYLDRYTGEVLRAESALEVPAARRFGFLFYPLHIGSFGGVWVKLLYALVGLAPALLAVTGFLIWFPRWRARRRRDTGEAVRRGEDAGEDAPPAVLLEADDAAADLRA